jgi:hypothetical protein
MKKVITFFATILTASVILSSCATLFRKPKNKNVETTIHISSDPSNAEVYIDDEKIDETPFNYVLKGRKSKLVEIKKEGYLNEQTKINRKINPLWTSISVLTGAYPGCGIPIIIDYSTGSLFDITTDSIHINLMSIKGIKSTVSDKSTSTSSKESNNTIKNQKSTNLIETNQAAYKENTIISFPALEILTGQYKLIILPKTRARFYLKNGTKFGGLITAIYDDHYEVKEHQDVYFSNLKKVRYFSPRLWYPILTSPSIFPPIIWFFSGKVAEYNSNKCKWDIQATRIVEGLPEHKYGKAKCD